MKCFVTFYFLSPLASQSNLNKLSKVDKKSVSDAFSAAAAAKLN
jgi:hypothetical protein